MKYKPTKFAIFLLLTAFLVTNLGSILGCVCCDSGSLSDIHIGNHIDDHSDAHKDKDTADHTDIHTDVYVDNQTVTLDQHISGGEDSCIDSPIQSSKGLVEEIESVKCNPSIAIALTNDNLTIANNISFVVSNSIQESPPRISQTLLTQRTVVLLN